MPRALYISPVWPRLDGRGTEQRAFRVLTALAERYRVSLLTTARVPRQGAPIVRLCEAVAHVSGGQPAPGTLAHRALLRYLPSLYYGVYDRPSDWVVPRAGADPFTDMGFDLVHVQRLSMLPVVQAWPQLSQARVVLDLDDIESIARARVARVAEANGNRRIAYIMRRDADTYRRIEQRALATLDAVYVCSPPDRERLAASGACRRVEVVPNVVDVPPALPLPATRDAQPFVFLFVGGLNYYPNFDALAFFCGEVVPLIRTRTSRPFSVRIVAAHTTTARRRVAGQPELSWAEPSAGLADEYRRAHAVIAPIRAGGGTRIKVLEAFAHGRPLIATPLAVEGLAVEPGTHALVGETPDDLAEHAVRLMADAAMGEGLAARAWALVRASYTPEVLRACLA